MFSIPNYNLAFRLLLLFIVIWISLPVFAENPLGYRANQPLVEITEEKTRVAQANMVSEEKASQADIKENKISLLKSESLTVTALYKQINEKLMIDDNLKLSSSVKEINQDINKERLLIAPGDIFSHYLSAYRIENDLIYFTRKADNITMTLNVSKGELLHNQQVIGYVKATQVIKNTNFSFYPLGIVELMTGANAKITAYDNENYNVNLFFDLDVRLKSALGFNLFINGLPQPNEPDIRSVGNVLLLPLETITKKLNQKLNWPMGASNIEIFRVQDGAKVSLNLATGRLYINSRDMGQVLNLFYVDNLKRLLPSNIIENLTGTNIRIEAGTNNIYVDLDARLDRSVLPEKYISDEILKTPFTVSKIAYNVFSEGMSNIELTGYYKQFNGRFYYETKDKFYSSSRLDGLTNPNWVSLNYSSLHGSSGVFGDASLNNRELAGIDVSRIRGVTYNLPGEKFDSSFVVGQIPADQTNNYINRFDSLAAGAKFYLKNSDYEGGISYLASDKYDYKKIVFSLQKNYHLYLDRDHFNWFSQLDLASISNGLRSTDIRYLGNFSKNIGNTSITGDVRYLGVTFLNTSNLINTNSNPTSIINDSNLNNTNLTNNINNTQNNVNNTVNPLARDELGGSIGSNSRLSENLYLNLRLSYTLRGANYNSQFATDNISYQAGLSGGLMGGSWGAVFSEQKYSILGEALNNGGSNLNLTNYLETNRSRQLSLSWQHKLKMLNYYLRYDKDFLQRRDLFAGNFFLDPFIWRFSDKSSVSLNIGGIVYHDGNRTQARLNNNLTFTNNNVFDGYNIDAGIGSNSVIGDENNNIKLIDGKFAFVRVSKAFSRAVNIYASYTTDFNKDNTFYLGINGILDVAPPRPTKQYLPNRGTVSGLVFLDENYNDIFDPDEKPLGLIDITLRQTMFGLSSNHKGYFIIQNLNPGIYYLNINTSRYPLDYVVSDTYNSKFTISPDQLTEVQVPIHRLGVIKGQIYRDSNKNKQMDIEDEKIDGASLRLYPESERDPLSSSGFAGQYSFSGLKPGKYTIKANYLEFKGDCQVEVSFNNINPICNILVE